jgi:hypothetical protein
MRQIGSGERGGLACAHCLTSIRMAGRNRKPAAESPNFVAQAVEKSGFEEGKFIWFLLRRIWISLRRIWFLLRPALILLRWIWISSPPESGGRSQATVMV